LFFVSTLTWRRLRERSTMTMTN
jgi:hypothetical protein